MGAKHYVDHETRLLVYSVLHNDGVKGENEALARQLHRSKGAITQEKQRIRRVMRGAERDARTERILAQVMGKRTRRTRGEVQEKKGLLRRILGVFG